MVLKTLAVMVFVGTLTASNAFGKKKVLLIASGKKFFEVKDKNGLDVQGKPTGVWFSEFADFYYPLRENKYEVDVATPDGKAVQFDINSLGPLMGGAYLKQYLQDAKDPRTEIFKQLANPKSTKHVNSEDYLAVFVAGGWAAKFDLPYDEYTANLISKFYASKKLIVTICHGSLALYGAKKPDGEPLVKGLKIAAVSNQQINSLKAVGLLPHNLAARNPCDMLREKGAIIVEPYLPISKAFRRIYGITRTLTDIFRSQMHIDEENLIITSMNQNNGIATSKAAIEMLELNSKL